MPDSGVDLGEKWERCRLDAMMKISGGIMLGGLASLLLFKLRTWPVFFGAGLGFGLAYMNCQQDINKTLKKH